MATHARTFDREKALEAVLFIATRLKGPSKHSIAKMLYLADKQHLHDYGRLICGDRYIAMEYGPVPSAIYDMLKVPSGRKIDPDSDEAVLEAIGMQDGRTVVPKRNPDLSLLSESEISCMERAIDEHGWKSFGALTDLTHDDAWRSTQENAAISLIAIARTLPDADALIEHLQEH